MSNIFRERKYIQSRGEYHNYIKKYIQEAKKNRIHNFGYFFHNLNYGIASSLKTKIIVNLDNTFNEYDISVSSVSSPIPTLINADKNISQKCMYQLSSEFPISGHYDVIYDMKISLIVNEREVYNSKFINPDMLGGTIDNISPIRCQSCKQFCPSCIKNTIDNKISFYNNKYSADVFFKYDNKNANNINDKERNLNLDVYNVNNIDYIYNRTSIYKRGQLSIVIYDEDIIKDIEKYKDKSYIIISFYYTMLGNDRDHYEIYDNLVKEKV